MEDQVVFTVHAGNNPVTGVSIHTEIFESDIIMLMGKPWDKLTPHEKIAAEVIYNNPY